MFKNELSRAVLQKMTVLIHLKYFYLNNFGKKDTTQNQVLASEAVLLFILNVYLRTVILYFLSILRYSILPVRGALGNEECLRKGMLGYLLSLDSRVGLSARGIFLLLCASSSLNETGFDACISYRRFF